MTEQRTLSAACFVVPHGRMPDIPDVDACPDDVDFILDNGYELTLEDIRGDFVAYLKIGEHDEDEVLVFRLQNEACRDTIKRLVESAKETLEEMNQ